jgi:hypothetical protein
MPVFSSCSTRSKIAMLVHSLAVPKVVGQAMCGLSGQEIVGIGGIEIGRFRRVDGRAAAERDEAVEIALHREGGRRLEGAVGGLDLDGIVYGDVDAGVGQRLPGDLQRRQARDAGIAEQAHPLHAQRPGIRAEFRQHADAELDFRRIDRKCSVSAGCRGEIPG